MIDAMYLFNERKFLTLDYFAARQWVRPKVLAVGLGIYPTRAMYSYLLRLRRWGYLWRGHDATGRIVYHLSPRGARWLLRARGVRSRA